MHRRDFAALLLSVLALHLALRRDDGLSLRKAWYHATPPDVVASLDGTRYVPPQPLVVDLNGDGRTEVLVATPRGQIELIAPAPPGKEGEGFAPAALLASAPLREVSGPDLSAAGARAAAFAAAPLEPPPADGALVRAPRKSIVVVLTSGWRALAFDHNLKPLWDVALKNDDDGEISSSEHRRRHHPSMREAAVLVSHHRLREGDKGSVFLVASSHVVSDDEDESGGGGNGGGDGLGAAANDAVDAEVEAHRRRDSGSSGSGKRRRRSLSAAASGAGDDFVSPGGTDLSAEETERRERQRREDLHSQFASATASVSLEYFALDGATGQLRWRASGPGAGSLNYSSGSDSEESKSHQDHFRPQHDVRLDAASAAAARAAHEATSGCRAFRESVLDVMPHSWSRRGDSRLRLAHFAHARRSSAARAARSLASDANPRGSRAASAIGGASAAAVGGRAAGRANAVARAASRVAAAATSSGRGGAGFRKSRSAAAAAAAADDATAAALAASRGTAGAAVRAWAATHRANSLVSHGSAGVDVLHLYGGARVCAVRLPSTSPAGAAADVDGDGVLDFVVAVTSRSHSGALGNGDDPGSHFGGAGARQSHHQHSRACQGVALAGVPPRQPLWNVSLCGREGSNKNDDDESNDSHSYFFGSRGGPKTSAVDAAPPAFLRVRDPQGRLTAAGGLVVFAVSNGVVTAARGVDGRKKWSVRSGCSWRPLGASAVLSSSATQHSPPVAPTLVPFPLRTHARPAAVLVAGDRRLALISAERGRVVAVANLPSSVAPPVLPLLAADADGDGLTDAIATTVDGVFGYAQARAPASSSPEALLTLVTVASMLAVWLSSQKLSSAPDAPASFSSSFGGDDDDDRGLARRRWRARGGGKLRATERDD